MRRKYGTYEEEFDSHRRVVSNVSSYVNKFVFVFLLFYAIATVFPLYLDGHMRYEMRRRKPELTLLLTK